VYVAADHLQEVGRPDRVLHPLLRPEPADEADQTASLKQTSEALKEQLRRAPTSGR
jgi:hypothetical protein